MLLALLLAPLALGTPPHHALEVSLDLPGHGLQVHDTLDLGDLPPGEDGAWHFTLHAGLDPTVQGRGWTLAPEPGRSDPGAQTPFEAFRLTRARKASPAPVLTYGGPLDHPLQAMEEDYQRGFAETVGTISEQGVFLAGSSAWVPSFGDGLITYDLSVSGLPEGWDVVSQGDRTRHEEGDGGPTVMWLQRAPTEEAHLIAGPFVVTTGDVGGVTFRAYLRQDDPGLVHRYLEATRRDLQMYQSILPPYPFGSFSLVENAWETGYGMPGFTLLGPQVLRMPWVLATSYPHEILHDWWGNSVYVDMAGGNWCEGLTSYMADHMLAEQKGEGVGHRRALLQKYTDFVGAEEDFPLTEFGGRSSAASEAVGYGKSAMLFHMLRRHMGDEAFLEVLRGFYEAHKFQRASWSDIAAAFEAREPGLEAFIHTWIARPGAPLLRLERVEVHPADAHAFAVVLDLVQAQAGEPFPLRVPVAITVEGQAEPVWHDVLCEAAACHAVVPVDTEPLRVDVDPMFDVMRVLDPHEVPPALSTVQGEAAALYVLPSAAPAEEQAAWRALAEGWRGEGEAKILLDSELSELPATGAWVLGWQNVHGPTVQRALGAQGVMVDAERIQIGAERQERADHSLVLVARAPGQPASAWAWVAADPAAAIPGLGRKLPHYSRYGWLAFQGGEPTNVAKGQWDPQGSPLTRNLSEAPLPELALPERAPLATLPPRFRGEALGAWVDRLADPALKGRGLGSPGLLQASAMVGEEYERLGLAGGGDGGGYRQPFRIGPPGAPTPPAANLVAKIPGTDPSLAPVLVMAHLDHLGLGGPQGDQANLGMIHPGADDNASGVATLLGLAGVLAGEPPRERTVVFAVTSAEEVGSVGAKALVASMGEQRPFACLNLDTVGRLSGGRLYVLNSGSAREWPFIMMGVGYTTGLDVAIVPEPLDASDDRACLDVGVPGIQLFTGPHADYHQPTDTPDKIDRGGLASVAEAAWQVVDYLAGRREPLTPGPLLGERTAAPDSRPGGHPGAKPGGHPGGHPGGRPGGRPGAPGERKVSLGTMPDFAFGGPGVRVQEVREGSPAAAAGIQAGDVLLAVDGEPLEGLRGLSSALEGHAAGDDVVVHLRRGDTELDLTATLEER
ncbi:MAG: M28 family peptidase [Pseudomonadota bacterium]